MINQATLQYRLLITCSDNHGSHTGGKRPVAKIGYKWSPIYIYSRLGNLTGQFAKPSPLATGECRTSLRGILFNVVTSVSYSASHASRRQRNEVAAVDHGTESHHVTAFDNIVEVRTEPSMKRSTYRSIRHLASGPLVRRYTFPYTLQR